MILIGITGSLGMGKTTVANMIRELSIPVHDSDATVHFLLSAGGEGVQTVGNMFPETITQDENGNQCIDRDKLGHIVFMDRKKKKMLEDYLHPLVRLSAESFVIEMSSKNHTMVGLDIPLLFETGREKDVDVTICVSTSKEKQKERVLSRPNMIEAKFDAIVAGQMTDEKKCLLANHVINSGQSMEDMREQVKQVIEKIEAMHGVTRQTSSGNAGTEVGIA